MWMPRRFVPFLIVIGVLAACPLAAQQPSPGCDRIVYADVAALDQPYMLNRLGASMPEGMVFALTRDVVPKACKDSSGKARACTAADKPSFGNATLRPGKRPRPIVLRANMGDCLSIQFTNLLGLKPVSSQPATRAASIHVAGMQVVKTIHDDGSNAGANATSLANPGQTITYLIRATEEGTYLLNSEGAVFGGENVANDGAQVTAGLFGAVNVEPFGAEWYRSQVTGAELEAAVDTSKGTKGFNAQGQPFLRYDAKSADGTPILAMLDATNHLVHSDLTAIITGPNHGDFVPRPGDEALFKFNYAEPHRTEPYREFTICYHELNDAVQAFPIFGGSQSTMLAPGADMFAINYGTGGITAEILGNRFGVGPMGSCPDCAFEEFFLSSWPLGDPAMVVDVPANAPCSNEPNNANVTDSNAPQNPCRLGVAGNAPSGITPYRKATKAFFPDDPSNVYHSYINDHLKFRILHAGTGVAHVHHQHAHQWLHTPNSNESTYLDSQLINPGSTYTLEMTYNGSGNRNKVVGDSIFHCHFYPHFAAGMWALWRTHDVFEAGTKLDSDGRPVAGPNRAYPDPEIAVGTPVPALVPIPTLAMAPAPAQVELVPVADPNATKPGSPPVGYRVHVIGDKNPGYPFFVPGVAGSRSPHPPLDFGVEGAKPLDGGLPRHLILNAQVTEQHTSLDFSKDMTHINAYRLPEDGTPEEKVAMAFHAQCYHPSFTPLGTPAQFRTNGLPPAPGAPYADPGLDPADDTACIPIKNWIRYKAAVVQTDVVFNKKGWHYPQARFLTLWQDVQPTMRGDRPPEPFFFRANSGWGVEYYHTNLVPKVYLLDDYQVKTPTDVIGQHIHLVKFDVTSSDGAGNGWNYEDGTFAPDEVQSRIAGMNECGGMAADAASIQPCGSGSGRQKLVAEAPPNEICPDPKTCASWFGAQTTVQRWFADPLEGSSFDDKNKDRTLRSVFTHDHFSPSTHQQTGLYAALLVEPPTSQWYVNDADATPMRTRPDGGPTSWQAIVETDGNSRNTYREFALALQDFQLAYQNTSVTHTGPFGWADPPNAIEPSGTNQVNGLDPQIISSGPTTGTLSFNYRNEPLPYRVATKSGGGGDARSTDLSYVFSSNVPRNDPSMNTQPVPGSPIDPANPSGFHFPNQPLTPGMQPGDPYTPLLRAYENDNVQIRLIAGAHMLPHDFTVLGAKWLFEPSFANSGYRNNQGIGISEHFEFLFNTPRASPGKEKPWADYLYMPDASNAKHGVIDGMWGIFRAYQSPQTDLKPLSTNRDIKPLPPRSDAKGYSCPDDLPASKVKTFSVVAQSQSSLVYNSRGASQAGTFSNKIVNDYPLLYTLSNNMGATEPLVLRANAGDCVGVTLQNQFNLSSKLFTGSVQSFAAFDSTIPLQTSPHAGLTAGLMSYDVMNSNGINVGFNPDQVVASNQSRTYWWYAGSTSISPDGKVTGQPIELAGVNLTPSDPLEQDLHGLMGAMVVEPPNTVACADSSTYASATIYGGGDCTSPKSLLYREFVMVTQDNLTNVSWPGATTTLMTRAGKSLTLSSQGSATQSSINYRTEPMTYRFNDFTLVSKDVKDGFSDRQVRTDPQTPIYSAAKGTPVRFHITHPGGSGNQQIITLHGHVWQELPFVNGSASIGDNTEAQHMGSRDLYGTNSAYPIVIASAGGATPVTGDYLYRTIPANFLLTNGGLWGLFRVTNPNTDTVLINTATFTLQNVLMVFGSVTPYLSTQPTQQGSGKPQVGTTTGTISLKFPDGTQQSVNVQDNGFWSYTSATGAKAPTTGQIAATSPYGGSATKEIFYAQAAPPSSTKAPENKDSSNFVDPPREHSGSKQTNPPLPPRQVPAPPPEGTLPKATPAPPPGSAGGSDQRDHKVTTP